MPSGSEPADLLQLFDRLYASHAAGLHDYLLGRTSDPEAARDVLQETFIRLWRKLAELRDVGPERQRAWLYTVARNLVVDLYRSRATAAATVRKQFADAPRAEVAPAAEAEALARNDVEVLDAAIARLPEDQRTALVLQVLGNRTSTEIGALLGRPPGTVRYQIAQARRSLARELQLEVLRS